MSLYAAIIISRQRKRYHKSVDSLSIGAWWKIQEEGDFKWLHKDLNGMPDITIKSAYMWKDIFNTYIKLVGLSENQEELTRLKVVLHGQLCSLIITGNPFINNDIAITEAHIKSIEDRLKDSEGGSNEETLIILEDAGKVPVDKWKISVLKYHTMIKYYTDKKKKEIQISKKQAA